MLEIKSAAFVCRQRSGPYGFALAGGGVALLPEWMVREALDAGTLVTILPEYTFARQGIYAFYPDARHVPAKVRTFIDFMRTSVS